MPSDWDDFSGAVDAERSPQITMARVFAEAARRLSDETGVQPTLERICQLALHTVPGCEYSSITLVSGRQVTTEGATDEVARTVDRIQYETGEGPCLNSIAAHEVVQSNDLSTESRWPTFCRRAVGETEVRSMLCFRLYKRENTMGALNLFSTATEAFEDAQEAHDFGAVFAAHAAVALAGAQEHANLDQALKSREVIGQAMGILVGRQGVSMDEAFAMLRSGSQRLNIKLRDVAQQIVDRNAPDSTPDS
jgi:transcriptional regulator with GAF, ATPase, and Fis domain